MKDSDEKGRRAPHGGIDGVAAMMQAMDESMRARLLSELALRDPGLAEQVQDRMFTFEDLRLYEVKGLAELLQKVPPAKWVIALRGVSEELKEHLYSALSKRAAGILREDLAASGPRRLSDVRVAQHEIIAIAREMEKAGKLVRATQ